MDATVIIVTYNSAETIGACVASVRAQSGLDLEIVVVDNASADGTAEVVRQLGSGIRLLANQENIGFGRANNQGFAASQGRYVYLLNPDAQLTESNALAELCAALERHPEWGVAGTRLVPADGRPKSMPASTYPGQKRVRRDFSKLPGTIAWVGGAQHVLPPQRLCRAGRL